jgi:hypothetical protein
MEMTQQQVLKNIVDGNLFGIVECDISVPDHLRTYFAEMQPIFKNAFPEMTLVSSCIRML